MRDHDQRSLSVALPPCEQRMVVGKQPNRAEVGRLIAARSYSMIAPFVA
jgi:hypothetical protein